MPLEFHDDAIILSGIYGTELKTSIIANYYKFWLNVTTRGSWGDVNIIEMNAGTGEIYIEDTKQTILGSAGHVLDLKYGQSGAIYSKLNIILIEEDNECRKHLNNVLKRRWPRAELVNSDGKKRWSRDGEVVLYNDADTFLNESSSGELLGISLFYFDPLLSVSWELIERITKSRIIDPFQIGTEFLIFFFTSDWINGRKKFHALPRTKEISSWNAGERKSVQFADETFGNRSWLDIMTSESDDEQLKNGLIELYKSKLRVWFRFVVPLPFVPKRNELYHVFCCSNFSVGTSVLSSIYGEYAQSFGLQADNNSTYNIFKAKYPSLLADLSPRKRPVEWRVLWHVMRNHADGICDNRCRTLLEIAGNEQNVKKKIKWLEKENYLKQFNVQYWPWDAPKFTIYQIDWEVVNEKLNVDRPIIAEPLQPPKNKG